jgi:hypothetical protein
MSESNQAQLQEAFQLIKRGQKEEAVSILRPLLTVDPNNADGWWLLANAQDDPAEQRSALEKVLILRPDHTQARERLNAIKQAQEFRFDDSSPSVGFYDEQKPKRGQQQPIYIQQEKKGTSPIVIILAVIGVLSLVVCGGCFFVFSQGLNSFGTVLSTVASSITSMPGSFPADLSDISNLKSGGSIVPGNSVEGKITTPFEMTSYTFNGERGQDVTITVKTTEDDFLPQIALYSPEDELIDNDSAFNFTDENNVDVQNASLTVELPDSGTYTIVVNGFVSMGNFTLRVE